MTVSFNPAGNLSPFRDNGLKPEYNRADATREEDLKLKANAEQLAQNDGLKAKLGDKAEIKAETPARLSTPQSFKMFVSVLDELQSLADEASGSDISSTERNLIDQEFQMMKEGLRQAIKESPGMFTDGERAKLEQTLDGLSVATAEEAAEASKAVSNVLNVLNPDQPSSYREQARNLATRASEASLANVERATLDVEFQAIKSEFLNEVRDQSSLSATEVAYIESSLDEAELTTQESAQDTVEILNDIDRILKESASTGTRNAIENFLSVDLTV